MTHQCEEWVSVCCGTSANEYAEEFCGACGEATGFECIECERPQETIPEATRCPVCGTLMYRSLAASGTTLFFECGHGFDGEREQFFNWMD